MGHMICPDCNRLRHEGSCDPVYEDEPSDLEMLAIDAERARERYLSALEKHKKERTDAQSL